MTAARVAHEGAPRDDRDEDHEQAEHDPQDEVDGDAVGDGPHDGHERHEPGHEQHHVEKPHRDGDPPCRVRTGGLVGDRTHVVEDARHREGRDHRQQQEPEPLAVDALEPGPPLAAAEQDQLQGDRGPDADEHDAAHQVTAQQGERRERQHAQHEHEVEHRPDDRRPRVAVHRREHRRRERQHRHDRRRGRQPVRPARHRAEDRSGQAERQAAAHEPGVVGRAHDVQHEVQHGHDRVRSDAQHACARCGESLPRRRKHTTAHGVGHDEGEDGQDRDEDDLEPVGAPLRRVPGHRQRHEQRQESQDVAHDAAHGHARERFAVPRGVGRCGVVHGAALLSVEGPRRGPPRFYPIRAPLVAPRGPAFVTRRQMPSW